MRFRKDWDLRSIPFYEIPDDLLRKWWATRNSKKGAAKLLKNDPKTEAQRAANRERVRKFRERQKKENAK